ncbi:MAG: hypothetical protein WCZ10_10535 [Desulfobulbaceae bacterium]
MTHASMVDIAYNWLLKAKRCSFALRELRHLGDTKEIPDCIGFRIGYGRDASILVECKLSREDFLADARKGFRRLPETGMGAYRFYLAPEGVIAPADLPPRWGLVLADARGRARQVVGPAGNAWSFSGADFLFSQRNLEAEWGLLASALRRVHVRGELEKIYDASNLP